MKKTQRTVKREDAKRFTEALQEFRKQFQILLSEAAQTKTLLENEATGRLEKINREKFLIWRVLDMSSLYFTNLVPLIHGVSISEQDKVRAALCKSCNVLSVEEVDKIVALFEAVKKNLESVVIEGEEK